MRTSGMVPQGTLTVTDTPAVADMTRPMKTAGRMESTVVAGGAETGDGKATPIGTTGSQPTAKAHGLLSTAPSLCNLGLQYRDLGVTRTNTITLLTIGTRIAGAITNVPDPLGRGFRPSPAVPAMDTLPMGKATGTQAIREYGRGTRPSRGRRTVFAVREMQGRPQGPGGVAIAFDP